MQVDSCAKSSDPEPRKVYPIDTITPKVNTARHKTKQHNSRSLPLEHITSSTSKRHPQTHPNHIPLQKHHIHLRIPAPLLRPRDLQPIPHIFPTGKAVHRGLHPAREERRACPPARRAPARPRRRSSPRPSLRSGPQGASGPASGYRAPARWRCQG
ncbi:hypothetical protein VTK56DRAFT_8809 [Thermocarpiscus australiensis]